MAVELIRGQENSITVFLTYPEGIISDEITLKFTSNYDKTRFISRVALLPNGSWVTGGISDDEIPFATGSYTLEFDNVVAEYLSLDQITQSLDQIVDSLDHLREVGHREVIYKTLALVTGADYQVPSSYTIEDEEFVQYVNEQATVEYNQEETEAVEYSTESTETAYTSDDDSGKSNTYLG